MQVHNKWKPIEPLLYWRIYAELHESLKVFGTATDMDGTQSWNTRGKPYVMTEWGFSDSDVPLIRYEKRGDSKEFFLNSISLIEG